MFIGPIWFTGSARGLGGVGRSARAAVTMHRPPCPCELFVGAPVAEFAIIYCNMQLGGQIRSIERMPHGHGHTNTLSVSWDGEYNCAFKLRQQIRLIWRWGGKELKSFFVVLWFTFGTIHCSNLCPAGSSVVHIYCLEQLNIVGESQWWGRLTILQYEPFHQKKW